jgi:hypothetical protein
MVNRNTGDIDILIEPSKEIGLRVVKALKSLGWNCPISNQKNLKKS